MPDPTDPADEQALRRVLRIYHHDRETTDGTVYEWTVGLNSDSLEAYKWVWLGAAVQSRLPSVMVAMPPLGDSPATVSERESPNIAEGATLGWAMVRALASMLCPTIRTQADANRLVLAVLLEEHGPREVRLIADAARPIYLTRIRPPGEAVGIDAINGAWSDGPTSEAWPALTRVIVEGAGEWVRDLALDCRTAGVAFEQIEAPTGQGAQR